MISDIVLNYSGFCEVHFTGSADVFKFLWKQIEDNINIYRTYSRIAEKTDEKDFIRVDTSANSKQVATATSRGAFEYQEQKCTATSETYIPKRLWENIEKNLIEDSNSMKMR